MSGKGEFNIVEFHAHLFISIIAQMHANTASMHKTQHALT